MNPTEIKLGNIIKQGRIDYIEANDETIIYIRCNGGYVDQAEPEPLTEEWLFKFGFKKVYHYYYLNNARHMGFNEEYGFFNVTNDIQIEYVHQLQNLYFAITGEELTIKE